VNVPSQAFCPSCAKPLPPTGWHALACQDRVIAICPDCTHLLDDERANLSDIANDVRYVRHWTVAQGIDFWVPRLRTIVSAYRLDSETLLGRPLP